VGQVQSPALPYYIMCGDSAEGVEPELAVQSVHYRILGNWSFKVVR
jgi:hypothetical protein